MPSKKLKGFADRPKPQPTEVPQQEERRVKESASGLSGRGADSALVHLIEQEKTRGRKHERS